MNTAEIKEAIVMLVPVKLVPDHHDHGKTGVIVAFHVPWRGHTRDLHVSVRWEDGEVSQHRHTRLMRV